MKKAFYALLAAALLFSLAGCGSSGAAKDAVKEEALLPPSSVRETGSEDQDTSSPALSETENPEATASAQSEATDSQAPSQAASSENQTAGAGSQAAAKPDEPPASEKPKPEPPAAEKPKPESPPAAEPGEPEPSAPEGSGPAPSVPEEPEAPAFEIGYWVSYGKNYGTGIGLALDETATACWDNPIQAGAHSKYLPSDISSTLDWYKASGFQYFWIWAESQGDGTYLYYIGYA